MWGPVSRCSTEAPSRCPLPCRFARGIGAFSWFDRVLVLPVPTCGSHSRTQPSLSRRRITSRTFTNANRERSASRRDSSPSGGNAHQGLPDGADTATPTSALPQERTHVQGYADVPRSHHRAAGDAPKHLISDKGVQFTQEGFEPWCRRRGIRHRFGAVGKYGSIAIIERLMKTIKSECIRRLVLVPFRRAEFETELALWRSWYNAKRPHDSAVENSRRGLPPPSARVSRSAL